MRSCALSILVLVLFSVPAFAQQAGRPVPRRLLLSVEQKQGSGFTPDDALMIVRSLHQRLQEADGQVVVVESQEVTAAATPEKMVAAAGLADADSWMLLTLDGRWASVRISIRAFDLLSKNSAADFSVTRSTWTSPASLPTETWADVVEAVAGKLPMVENAAPPAANQKLARVTIKALPGSVVAGLGAAPIRIDSSGSTFRMLAVPREYLLRTSLPGYAPVTQRIFLSGDRNLTPKQTRVPMWGVDVSLSDSRAPGVDLTMAYPSLRMFVRLGVTTYALALALNSTEVFLSEPLTNIDLRAGIYLSPEDRFFRFYLGLGGFARIVHAKDTFPMFDPVAPAGVMVLVGTDVPVSARGRLYFEYTPSIYLTSVPDTLHAALGPDNAPGWIFASSAGFNLLSFRIGYRWPL